MGRTIVPENPIDQTHDANKPISKALSKFYGKAPDGSPGIARVSVFTSAKMEVELKDDSSVNCLRHGFMLHCDEYDWIQRAYYREAKEVRNRPGAMVIYVPQ